MIFAPFYQPRSKIPDLDRRIFQTSQENWKSCGPNGIHYASTKEPGIISGNLRIVNMNIYQLWCQDLVFFEYYTTFTIAFLVDTLELLRQLPNFWEWFHWPTCKDGTEDWIHHGVTCATTNGPKTQLHSKLHKCSVGYLFGRTAMDLAGPFPISQRDNRNILEVAIYFSKWCEANPVPIIDALEIAKVFVENWISHYGVPLELYADHRSNATRLESKNPQFFWEKSARPRYEYQTKSRFQRSPKIHFLDKTKRFWEKVFKWKSLLSATLWREKDWKCCWKWCKNIVGPTPKV